jgi:hypothetical protein
MFGTEHLLSIRDLRRRSIGCGLIGSVGCSVGAVVVNEEGVKLDCKYRIRIDWSARFPLAESATSINRNQATTTVVRTLLITYRQAGPVVAQRATEAA